MIRKLMVGTALVAGLVSMGAGTSWADDPPPSIPVVTQPGVLPPPPDAPTPPSKCQPGVIGCNS